jgi:hypothetical protein
MFVAAGKAFEKSHRACKRRERECCSYCFQFDHEPSTCPKLVSEANLQKWWNGPDTGTSSKALYTTLTGQGGVSLDQRDPPSDPSDFGRCFRFLQAFPELRARIGEMRTVKGWAPLVDAWDELERLYLEEVPNHRGAAPRLYARMRELLGR